MRDTGRWIVGLGLGSMALVYVGAAALCIEAIVSPDTGPGFSRYIIVSAFPVVIAFIVLIAVDVLRKAPHDD